MHDFRYVRRQLYCEGVSIDSLAKRFGTPLYVYSQHTLTDHFQKLDRALAPLDHLVCFAMKANSNAAVMRTLANLGRGFDVVSEGELRRVLAAGGDPTKCVFAGVGKTEREIEFALSEDIYSFNVESEPELARISNVASRLKNIRLRGLQMHIGSQLTTVKPFELAVKKVLPLVSSLKSKYGLEFFSIGGGLGIMYENALSSGSPQWWHSARAKQILTPAKYAATLVPMLKPLQMRILIEPGRFIVGNAGILVTRVEYVKRTGKKNFVIVDAAMNDFIRPAFYDSYHEIVPTMQTNGSSG